MKATSCVAVALAVLFTSSVALAEGPSRRVDRVAEAKRRYQQDVTEAFQKAGAAWPPKGLFLRAFKREGALEVWAAPPRGGPLVLVRTIEVCRASGELGPKRREGDLQVPEGFYRIDRFNPRSKYHLSLGLDYPNAVDRHRAGDAPPGSDIFIHGECVTVGCLPIENGPISWLYVAALAARGGGRTIPVHVFPCRMDREDCAAALAEHAEDDPELAAFWETLRVGYRAFEERGLPPKVTDRRDGTYRITPVGDVRR